MSDEELDQIVKGAVPPGLQTSLHAVSASSRAHSPASSDTEARSPLPPGPPPKGDPQALLPSSPGQIYLNLLILEASLRHQYLRLRARRRQNAFFLFLLAAWNAGFFYLLFLQPREDGSGLGGSVYWVVDTAEKVALMGGIVTGILIWGTGQWERGFRWPRRFVGVTNRGLRSMNCKIVVLRGPWWRELLGYFSFLVPHSSYQPDSEPGLHHTNSSNEKHGHSHGRHRLQNDHEVLRGEDLSPGGDVIKLLLLPKPFSPGFRQDWENYRAEYWEAENERRARLRLQLKEEEHRLAKERGRYSWWFGFGQSPQGTAVVRNEPQARAPSQKEIRTTATRRIGMHSREPSRSSTPGTEIDERPPSASGSTVDGKRRTRASMAGLAQPHAKQTRNSLRSSNA